MQDDRIFVFLHTPKVAGGSLNRLIYTYFCTDKSNVINVCCDDKNYQIHSGIFYFPAKLGFLKSSGLKISKSVQEVLSRNEIKVVLGHSWFGIHKYFNRPWTYITLLRNPIERVISLYYHLGTWKTESIGGISIEKFAKNPPFKEVDNDQTRRISGLDPELGECTRATLAQAKENLNKYFSLVGITERFNETLVLLKQEMGWNQELFFAPQIHKNPDRPLMSSLPTKTLDAIIERNELDIELYEFAKNLLEEKIAAQGPAFYRELENLEASIKKFRSS